MSLTSSLESTSAAPVCQVVRHSAQHDISPARRGGLGPRFTRRQDGHMASAAQWLEGARPRTLPAAIAPVLVGSGAAAADDGFRLCPAVLALVLSPPPLRRAE